MRAEIHDRRRPITECVQGGDVLWVGDDVCEALVPVCDGGLVGIERRGEFIVDSREQGARGLSAGVLRETRAAMAS